MGLSFALVCLWSTLNNLGIVNSDLPITAMDTLTMDLDPGTITTILAILTTDLFTPTTILATTTKHHQTFHRLGNVLPHSKRLVSPNLEDKVFQLSIVTASVDFVTFVTPDKLPVYPNVPADVPPEKLNVTNFVKLAKLSAWPAESIE